MSFSIHQFSSGILNPSRHQRGEWVSGGFDSEIANKSFTVPEEIERAVNTQSKGGWRGLGIKDAYPPKPGDIALIARDLGRYCVLAVANIQKDDKGSRSFIAYRYFWLDKKQFRKQQNVDGIATLLWYWQEKGNPQFDIGKLVNNKSSYTTSWDNLPSPYLFEHIRQRHSKRITEFLKAIGQGNEPLLYEADKIGGKLSPEEVNCLAIQYNIVNKRSISSWAWNVRRLETTENLNVIYCADAEAYNWFKNKVQSLPLALAPASAPSSQTNARTSDYASGIAQVQLPPETQCLHRFLGTLKPEDVLNLMNYYQQHQDTIRDFQEHSKIENFQSEMPDPRDHLVRYATLLTALAPNQNQEIFRQLTNLKDSKKIVAIDSLTHVMKIARQNKLCKNHFIRDKFYGSLSFLKDELSDSLNLKDSFFNSLRNLLPVLIFFFLLLGGGVVFAFMFSWPSVDKTPLLNVSGNSNVSLLYSVRYWVEGYNNLYRELDANKRLSEYNINFGERLQSELNKYKTNFGKRLQEDKELFETKLKSSNANTIQEARKEPSYIYLQQLTTLASGKLDDLPNLKKGPQSVPADVVMLQKSLERGPYYSRNPPGQQEPNEGVFDDETETAVKNAQEAYNNIAKEKIDVDGIVGKQTWTVLINRLQDLQVESVYETLQQHLSQDNSYNIVTEIEKCRDDNNKNKTPLLFGSCLEKIGKPKESTNGTAGSDSTTNQKQNNEATKNDPTPNPEQNNEGTN